MLIPKQSFNHWYVISALPDSPYNPAFILAGSQSKPQSNNPDETITVFRPDADDFETIPQWRIFFTVNIIPNK